VPFFVMLIVFLRNLRIFLPTALPIASAYCFLLFDPVATLAVLTHHNSAVKKTLTGRLT
jgi:hypothetical protein